MLYSTATNVFRTETLLRAACRLWEGKGKFSKQRIFLIIRQINLRTFCTTTFIVHDRSFIFIGYENE